MERRGLTQPGPTVTELIRGYRLDRILAGLRSPAAAGDSISQVAARWGVHDMPHFSRAFRARYGMTPSQARHEAAGAGLAGQPGGVHH